MSVRVEADIDKDYLSALEQKLSSLLKRGKDSTNPNQRKNFLDDFSRIREQHLAELHATEPRQGFEDDFLNNVPIQANWVQRKIAPDTVAVNRQELVKLAKSDALAAIFIEKELEVDDQKADTTHSVVIDINGVVYWLNGGRTFELGDFLAAEERNLDDFSLELVNTATASAADDSTDVWYLAACWVVYDQVFAPIRYFVQFFSVSADWKFRLWHKSDVDDAPTLARLTRSSPISPDQLYWLIFNYSKHAFLFTVEPESNALSPIDTVGDTFPALEIGQIPGAVIRADDWLAAGKYLFLVLGYDSGYVVASVITQLVGIVVDRKMIKFNGPISVLRLVNSHEDSLSTSVLVSSTLGPAAIWSLRLTQGEVLIWEMCTLLLNSEIYDAILSCAVSRDYIFIGNYGEQVLVYSLLDAVNLEFCEVYPILAMNVASPVLAIEFLESAPVSDESSSQPPADRQLIVLSYKGVHRYAINAAPTVCETLLMPTSPLHATPPLSGSLPLPVPSIGDCVGGLSSGSASPAVLQVEPGSDSPELRGSPPWTLPLPGYTEGICNAKNYQHKQSTTQSDHLLWQHPGQSAPSLHSATASGGVLLLHQQHKSGHRGMRLTHPLHTSHQHVPRQISHHEVSDDVKSKAFFQK